MRQKPKKGTFGIISARKARKQGTYSGSQAGILNRIREKALTKKGAFKLPPYRKVSKKLRKRTVELFGEKDNPYYKSLPQFRKFQRPLKQNESKNRLIEYPFLNANPFLNAMIPNASITTAPLFAPPALVPLAD